EICKKIQLVKGEKNRLLLKNPWDFPNFLFIKEKIPQSKFIFIHRHPLDIMNSSMNALRVIINKETVYSEIFSPFAKKIDENPLLQWFLQSLLIPQLPVGLSLLIENRVRYTKKFLTDIKKLDKKSFINIKYEDLCNHTSSTMKKVFNHLQLDSVDFKQFEDFIQPRNLSYLPEIYNMKPYILNRFKKYCTFFNYQ
ncbi:MAG: sulfotransferase, partial [Candidatus Thermoplasmatota archaeon]|nr:sulfotransferase [Candidatus Thermoplasmatota archaeon]